MKGIEKKHSAALTCLLILFVTAVLSHEVNAQTSVFINPPTQNVSLYSSSIATVNTSISNVNYLYGYQHDILYSQGVLNINQSGITEGPFLKTGGVQTYFISGNLSIPGAIKNIACTRIGSTNVSGSGNLTRLVFSINLTIMPPVTTQINIVNSKLSDINSQSISHTIANGTINIKACLAGETKPCGSNVGECRSGTQTCLANETWNATCGGTYVGPTAELCNGRDDDCDTQYDENATGSGNLSRSCSLFHNGTCAIGNEICNGVGYVGCPTPTTEICYDGIDQDCDGIDSTCKGDVANSTGNTPDGCIDIFDLSSVALDFGKTSGFINPNTDIDKSGVVDIFDLVYVGKDFGVKRSGATC
jgi:hypothetical protein